MAANKLKKEQIFKKKFTVIPTPEGGFAVGLYGKPTGEVFKTPEEAQQCIDNHERESKSKTKK